MNSQLGQVSVKSMVKDVNQEGPCHQAVPRPCLQAVPSKLDYDIDFIAGGDPLGGSRNAMERDVFYLYFSQFTVPSFSALLLENTFGSILESPLADQGLFPEVLFSHSFSSLSHSFLSRATAPGKETRSCLFPFSFSCCVQDFAGKPPAQEGASQAAQGRASQNAKEGDSPRAQERACPSRNIKNILAVKYAVEYGMVAVKSGGMRDTNREGVKEPYPCSPLFVQTGHPPEPSQNARVSWAAKGSPGLTQNGSPPEPSHIARVSWTAKGSPVSTQNGPPQSPRFKHGSQRSPKAITGP